MYSTVKVILTQIFCSQGKACNQEEITEPAWPSPSLRLCGHTDHLYPGSRSAKACAARSLLWPNQSFYCIPALDFWLHIWKLRYADLDIIVGLRTILKLDFAVLRFLFNIIILLTALRRLPELRGYRGRRYPGQLPPSKPTIQPRRLNLPPDWQWQNIGSRRTKFLDLGMPTFGRPRKIIVKPLLHINNEDMDEIWKI